MTHRSTSAALMALSEGVARLTDGAAPVNPSRLTLGEAVGGVAAEDMRAADPLPAGPTALRDGWAVSLGAVAGASTYAPVALAHPAPWVEAGELLPPETDTVLPPEAVEGCESREIVVDAPLGDGTRQIGQDLRPGDLLAAAGDRITARHVLALATAGIGEIRVRRPRIRLIATGDHRDAILPALAAWIGGVVERVRVPNDVAAIADAMAADGADAVLVVGGTGFGRTDVSATALARVGTLQAHGIALRPGETTGFGIAAGQPVLLVPGRPDAALAAFLTLGRPLLAALSGLRELPGLVAPLTRRITSAVGLAEIVFVRREGNSLAPLGGADLPLRRLVEADGAILVSPDSEGYPAGARVVMMPL